MSRVVNIIKSVHSVLYFVTPSLPKEYFEIVDFLDLMKMLCIIINIFIKRLVAITPCAPAYSVYVRETDDNNYSGRPLSVGAWKVLRE